MEVSSLDGTHTPDYQHSNLARDVPGAPLERVLARLHGVRELPGGGWAAQCPAHDDRHASLTVNIGDTVAVVLKCHAGAGCPNDQIVAALGLEWRDLFPDDQT